ncbi:hypothetical protein AAEP93_008542 [Penicillium crustosum]
MFPQPAFRVQLSASISLYSNGTRRLFSATSTALNGQNIPIPDSVSTPINPRWLTMTKRRIGKCMMFGMKPAQIDEGGKILQQLAKEWRELIAGSEGFLTDKKRRSLYRHNVVWGEQPMESPDKITVYQKLIPDPSRHLSAQSAFRLEVMILSEAHQRPAARCFEDIVIYDYKKNRKTVNIPPFVMEQFETMWKQQEQEEVNWRQRIADIENRVRNLELGSWDRADAVEDNGSASQ